MSHDDLEATVNVALLLSINTKGIPDEVKDMIKENIILRFNRDEALLLDSSENLEVKMEESHNIIKYTVRKILHTGMASDIFLSPFEVITLIMSVTVQSLSFEMDSLLDQEFEDENGVERKKMRPDISPEIREFENFEVKFNLMDLDEAEEKWNKFVKISFTEEGTFGNYDLAENKLSVDYTNENTASKIRNNTKKLTNTQEKVDYSKIT